jgi:cell division topological specificity factor
MFNFLKPRRSAASAKERLQLVLIHDRTDLTPGELDALKDDLLDVISRHVDIEPDEVRIGLERDGRSQRLVADIPIRSTVRRRGG